MSDNSYDDEILEPDNQDISQPANPIDGNYQPVDNTNEESVHHLSGMFRTWFLQYSSYTNLSRAVPHLLDGFKPVQRRVLHALKRMEDGRLNKVAAIVGETMKFHPHGDASIYEALVVLGQKDLLIDHQGNWGNILTGDEAAAARYIEAKLSKFALEVLFNKDTTEWKKSYDGRFDEPVWLPAKFPILLAQGSEGIGLGMNSRILPHNFNEIADAAIAHLRGEEFQLFPDFPTGGQIDVANYRDGLRGGKVKIRAKIEKRDSHTLVVTEIPYGLTVTTLCDSIQKAKEQGKIAITKIEDKTAAKAEIVLRLEAKQSPDKMIDALYAFTECEHSYSPNCCVIHNNTPRFITVSELLCQSTDTTKELLLQELNLALAELTDKILHLTLEKIFIEDRIYKAKEFEQSRSNEEAIRYIDTRIEPYKPQFIRPITDDDLLRLLELKMARILRFNADKANELLVKYDDNIAEVRHNIDHIVDYTIQWFEHLKETYGDKYQRLTEIRNFENIVATKVVSNNAKLYVNREEGFVGYALKREDNVEFVCDCSDIDDVIVFLRNGEYKVQKVSEKAYFGKDIIHVAVFHKNDKRTIYNVVYRDGKVGPYYMKRFAVDAITRDKVYRATSDTEGSRIFYFSANPNGEVETIRIYLKQTNKRLRNMQFEKNFNDLAIKGRQSRGNLLTKYPIYRIAQGQKGGSTLGGTPIWFDTDVNRLNGDRRGEFLGEFNFEEQILVIYKNGEYVTTNFDLNNHYDDNILRIEKFDAHKTWTAILNDAEAGYPYLKRFTLEPSVKTQSLIGGNAESTLVYLTDTAFPHLLVKFAGESEFRPAMELEAADFVGVKSFKAKGKRLTTYTLGTVEELEPTRQPEPTEQPEVAIVEEDGKSDEEIINQYRDDDEPAKTTLIYTNEDEENDGTESDNDDDNNDSSGEQPPHKPESDDTGQQSLF